MKFDVPKDASNVLQTLRSGGYEAYIVGGCVRDTILNRETTDWDFTTNARPEQILALFTDGFYDNSFGTVGVPIHHVETQGLASLQLENDNKPVIYEITTYRSERGYSDHRHPDEIVWGDTLEEDLKRRDFTINAIAYDGKSVIDNFDGQKDIDLRLIRAVGDPNQRFSDDALRMMRAVRIATQLQFMIEPQTFEAIRSNAHLLKKIAWERIRDELLKILGSQYPTDGIRLLRNTSMLSVILPELEASFGVEQKSIKRHHVHDVGTHLLLSLQHCPSSDPITRLATLLHDIGKPATVRTTAEGVVTFYNHEIVGGSMATQIARRLRLSKKDTDKLFRLVRYHQFTVDERQTDSALRRFIRNVTKEYLDDMLALRTGDRLGGGARETSWRLELYKKRLEEVQQQPFSVSDLKANGHDVMKIYDMKPGPLVGSTLNILFEDVVAGKLPNEREALLKRIEDLKKEPLPERAS